MKKSPNNRLRPTGEYPCEPWPSPTYGSDGTVREVDGMEVAPVFVLVNHCTFPLCIPSQRLQLKLQVRQVL